MQDKAEFQGRSASVRNILVIEDDSDIRETLKDLLEFEGYKVVTASNGKDALGRLRETVRPDLIILDLMMPVMNGWDFLVEQSADESLAHIPVIVISAAGLETQGVQKVAACLNKPFEMETLLATVSRVSEAPAGVTCC